MKALGLINTFDELAETDRRLGRKVANHQLVVALLEHSTAQELHFFLPFATALGAFRRGYAPWLERPENQRRVKLLPAVGLAQAMTQTDYTAIHAAELERFFPELCHLRNRNAQSPFPVTCMPHTMSYWSTQVRNLYKVMPGARDYDSIFCTSRAARDHLDSSFRASGGKLRALGMESAGYAGRLDLAPLGVNISEFGWMAREEARKRLGLPQDQVIVLCLGRLTPSDKYDLMPILGLISTLPPKSQPCLVLAGSGMSYGRTIMQAAQDLGVGDKVRLLADFDSSLKETIYAAADIFLSPADNLQETFGLTLLEAMASRLPVLAGDFSGYRDLVVEGETGFLAPTYGPSLYDSLEAGWRVAGERSAALQVSQRTALDLVVLRARLEELSSSADLRERMGRAGRERVKAVFDWPVVVARMESLWMELKAQARARGPEPPAEDVLGAGLGELFGHFVTRTLSPQEKLVPGPLAGAFARAVWGRTPHPDLAGSLPLYGLEGILIAMQANGGEICLDKLTEHLSRRIPAEVVGHLALHGLKMGVLALAKPKD